MSRFLALLALTLAASMVSGQDWYPTSSQMTFSGAGGTGRIRSAFDLFRIDLPDHNFLSDASHTGELKALLPVGPWLDEIAEVDLGIQSPVGSSFSVLEDSNVILPEFDFASTSRQVIRGQSSDGGGGGAGAAAATDPSVPLTQLQLQNQFTPETYDATGYSNTFIIQPVIPLNIDEDAFFPYHIIRPTIPVIAPTADPDGPTGVHGGLGDTTIVDAFIHPIEELKTNVGIGYVATLPTRTHPALGRGEWQFGPSAVVISRAIPKWIFGGLVEVPFSLESDAYAVQMQPIALRLLPDEWFIGVGDQLLKFDDQNGGYDIPLSLQLGKVVNVGDTPMKVFVEPIYTPEGLRSGPGGTEWGIKLNVTFLFPDAKFFDPLLGGCGGQCR